MSDTPRTDAAEIISMHPNDLLGWPEGRKTGVVPKSKMKELERELAEANYQVGKYADEARQAIDAHGAAVIELAAVKQTMGELCESCGWAMRFPGQPCRCELERELAGLKESVANMSHPNIRDLLRERETLEGMYHKVVSACLRCDPIPACEREDDELEPPWEAIDRIRQQRDRLAEALRDLCETLLVKEPRDITDLLNKAGDALAVKGGSDE